MNEHQDHGPESSLETPSGASNTPEERGGDVLSLIADVESHLARIRNVQSRQQDEFADLAERQRRVTAAQSLVEERTAELARLEEEISEARASLDTERTEFQSNRDAFEEACQQHAEETESLREERRGLEEIASRNERDAHENREERSRLEGWSSELADRERLAEDRISGIESERAKIQADLERAEAEFRARCEEHEAGERAFTEQRETLDRRIEELIARTNELESEKSDANRACEEARRDLESTKSRFISIEREYEQGVEAVSTLEERISSQEEAIAQGVEMLTAARTRIADLETVTQEDQRQLQLAGTKLTELAKAIAEQAPRLEKGTEAMALVVELESELQSLRNQRQESRDEVEAPLLARIADLESGLELARKRTMDTSQPNEDVEALVTERTRELQAALDAAVANAAASADEDSVSRETFDALEAECRRLSRRGDELETALSMTTDRGQAQEMAKQLRRRAERVGEIARHLDRRKNRLNAMRSTLRRRERQISNDVEGVGSIQDNQRIDAQRQELAEVRDFLARSEQQMVKRWARPRAFASVAWLLVILALSAAAGWIASDRFMPGPGSAAVLLTARTADSSPLTERGADDWNEWHRALATDPAFIALVQKRLAMRGIASGQSEEATSKLLLDHLSFENEGVGRMRLVLAGDDRRTVEPTLDAIATAMVSESSRQAPRREQGARATLPPERSLQAGGGYAARVDTTPDREMLLRGGLVGGGVFLTSLLLVGLVYSVLSRSKKVFENRESGNDAAAAA